MKRQKIKFIPAVLTAILIFYLLINRLQNQRPASVESPNRIAMNTIVRVVAIAPDEKTAQLCIDSVFKEICHLEKLMNRYDPNSQLSQVNKFAAKQPVKINKDLFDILQQSVEYSRKTAGAFDITVAPLVDLWKKCAEANSMPTDEQLAKVKETIGYDKLLLDANDLSVRFTIEGVSLDLGAIAKGFAIDLAIKDMKNGGAIGGLIDIGGDIGCFGTTEKKSKWVVGVRNPAKANGQIITKLSLSDMAVATSGDYERFYKIGSHHFSHIFDPATEKSAGNLSSVTVIAENATAADALATAVSVLGAEKGLELIEKTENTEALFVKAGSQEIIKSGGMQQYLSD